MKVNNAIGINGNLVGVEVKNIQDVVKAQAAGLIITDENGCRFNYFVMNEETGEEREATEQEIFDQITAALAEGETVFACMEIMDGLHVAKKTNTNLRSDFYVHQHVYTMHENKIVEGEIVYLSLAYGRLGDDVANTLYGNMAEQLYYNIGYYFTNGRTPKISNDDREQIIKKINSLKMHAHIVLKMEKGGYLTRDLKEIFYTKQRLVDSLIED